MDIDVPLSKDENESTIMNSNKKYKQRQSLHYKQNPIIANTTLSIKTARLEL